MSDDNADNADNALPRLSPRTTWPHWLRTLKDQPIGLTMTELQRLSGKPETLDYTSLRRTRDVLLRFKLIEAWPCLDGRKGDEFFITKEGEQALESIDTE